MIEETPIPLASARQDLIMTELRRSGTVRVRDLAAALDVSPMTVRRDLDALARLGTLSKVHGGATLPSPELAHLSSSEPPYEAKDQQQRAEKAAIASIAAELVNPGEAIGLTGGTTTARVAQLVASVRDLIVVTNSLRVLDILGAAPSVNRTVILTGGIPTPSAALVGPVADQALGTLHLDRVFMGVHGMSERTGFTTPNFMEAKTNQAFIAASEELVVVADATKWETVGLSTITQLHDADVVISDINLDSSARATLESHSKELILATP